MTISFKGKVPILLLCAGVAMITGGLVTTYRSKKVFDNSAFWTEHTHAVILETQIVLSTIQDLQIGGRGYIITGDSSFLEPVNLSRDIVNVHIQKLRTLTLDNPYQGPRIDSVVQLAHVMINYVIQYTSLRREKGFSAASRILGNRQGMFQLKSIRHVLKRIQMMEYKLLLLRKAESEKSIAALNLVFIFLLGSQALFIVIIFLVVRHNIRIKSKTAKAQALYELIVASSDDAIISQDLNGIITSWNRGAENMFHYTTAEIVGKPLLSLIPNYRQREEIEIMASIAKDRAVENFDTERLRKDGTIVQIALAASPLKDAKGKIVGASKIARDITRRKKAEEENEIGEIRFRNTLDKMLEGVEILGFDCRYLYVNEAYEKQVKHTKGELLGFTVMEKFPGIEQTAIFKAILRCLDERVAIQMEDEFTFPDKTCTSFEISFQPVPEGVFILSMDITEKRQAEEKIRHGEERFRALIENSYDIVSISDEKFLQFYRSPASARITGWTDKDRDTVGAVDQTHPDDVGRLRKTMKDVLENPGVSFPSSFRTRHKKGHYVFLEGTITNQLNNESIKGIVSNFRDVTGARIAEEQKRESEKIYRTIASGIPGSVICLLDKDYRYFLIEGDLLESLGYSKEKLLGKKIVDVVPHDRFEEVAPYFRRVFEGESFTVESVREGIDILNRYVPLRDEKNEVFAAMVVLFDVSELKNAQRVIAELNAGLEVKINERTLELEMVNKELESFSYSVAHDLRAPLRAVSGYATMVEEDYGHQLDQEGNRLIGAVQSNAKKMGTLIDDLLAFSKLGRKQIQKSLIDMNQLTVSSMAEIHLNEGHPAEIKIKCSHFVMADPSLMKHVMINLLSNAIKYSSKKEKPMIEISSRQENEEIIYSVKDNGVGFDMKYADKLFGVFQRLHSDEEFDGTGVGLAIVQRIIHRHGGRIWASSELGQGATFSFSLPVISEAQKN